MRADLTVTFHGREGRPRGRAGPLPRRRGRGRRHRARARERHEHRLVSPAILEVVPRKDGRRQQVLVGLGARRRRLAGHDRRRRAGRARRVPRRRRLRRRRGAEGVAARSRDARRRGRQKAARGGRSTRAEPAPSGARARTGPRPLDGEARRSSAACSRKRTSRPSSMPTRCTSSSPSSGRRRPCSRPIPASSGRLIGEKSSWVDAHRLEALGRAVERFGCVVLLKGADTLSARPAKESSSTARTRLRRSRPRGPETSSPGSSPRSWPRDGAAARRRCRRGGARPGRASLRGVAARDWSPATSIEGSSGTAVREIIDRPRRAATQRARGCSRRCRAPSCGRSSRPTATGTGRATRPALRWRRAPTALCVATVPEGIELRDAFRDGAHTRHGADGGTSRRAAREARLELVVGGRPDPRGRPPCT